VNISPKIKKQLRWQNVAFVAIFLIMMGILAWLSVRFEYSADWTSNAKNTPSDATLQLLSTVEEPLKISAFISSPDSPAKKEINSLIKMYQRYKKNISVEFINPQNEPDLVREKNIRFEGELILEMSEQEEKLKAFTEQSFTNAIQRLARKTEHWIIFLEGHDERSPYGDSSFDFSSWTQLMKAKGLNVRGYNLASNSVIPDNTSLLVIADPQKNLLHGEIQVLLNYIEGGGNLLWLLEPENSQSVEFQGLEELAETLGIELVPGMVVDPNTQLLGINDPRFTLIPEYPRNPITENFNSMSIFPTSKAMEFFGSEEWDSEVLFETMPRSWSETDDTVGDIQMDVGQDIPGPLIIGLSLNRRILPPDESEPLDRELTDNEIEEDDLDKPDEEQRVVVIGDSDFVSDAYIGEAGNMDVAMNIVNWLVKDESFISIPSKTRTNTNLELSKTHQIIIGVGFLIIIPVGFLSAGLIIWMRRRKK